MADKEKLYKILVADDSPTIVDIMKFMLEASGYEVVIATNGMEAILQAFKEDPDLILLDVEMPKMNGYQVCRYLKEDRYMKQTPIIILTSHAHKKMRFLGVYTGADEYLIKDDDQEQVLSRIDYYIKRKKTSSSAVKGKKGDQVTEESVLETVNSILDKKLIESTIINQVGRLAASLDRFELVINSIFGLIEKMEEFDFASILVKDIKGAKLFIQTQRSMPQELIKKFEARVMQSGLQNEVILDTSKIDIRFIPRTEKGEYQKTEKRKHDLKSDNLKFHDITLRSRTENVGLFAIANFSDEQFPTLVIEMLNILSFHVATLLDNWLLFSKHNELTNSMTSGLSEINQEILHELQDFAGRLSKPNSVKDLAELAVKHIPSIIPCEKISIIIKNRVASEDRYQSFGRWGDEENSMMLDVIGEWLISEQLKQITNLSIINDTSKIPFFATHELDKDVCKNLLIVPVFKGEEKLGLITLFDKKDKNGFHQHDLEILRFISGVFAISLKPLIESDQQKMDTINQNFYKRFLSDELATNVLIDPDLLPKNGIERHVTFMFVDLVDFEALQDDHSTQALVAVLNAFNEHVTQIAFNFLGTIEKYREYGLKCMFGIPSEQPDDAERAVQCAMEIRKWFNVFIDDYSDVDLSSLGLKIVIHTGDISFGAIGEEFRSNFVSFGHEIDFAKRVMLVCQESITIISESTIMELEGHYSLLNVEAESYQPLLATEVIYQLIESS